MRYINEIAGTRGAAWVTIRNAETENSSELAENAGITGCIIHELILVFLSAL